MTEQEFTEKVEGMGAEIASLKSALAGKENDIKNLDASIKDQQTTIEQMKADKALAIADFKTAFRTALEGVKPKMQEMFGKKADRFEVRLEIKTDPTAIGTSHISPNYRLGFADDPTIYASAPVANQFIAVFGIRPATANKLGWIEASSNPVVAYVGELAQNTNLSDVSFVEKSRAFGKLATYMTLSTEFEDWFANLYDYCVNEGVRMIENKLDDEIFNGGGSDASYPNKIYGLKGAATAFSALAANAVQDATIADVIIDSRNQAVKAGYNPSVAFVTWEELAELEALKDANGNYIYDKVNGLLRGIRVIPSTRLASGEILVADTNCASIYAGNSYELEFIRNGAYDAYDVYFRKRAQVKVTSPQAKGLVYVASVATAISALTKSGAFATLAGAVNSSGQLETHPNEAAVGD